MAAPVEVGECDEVVGVFAAVGDAGEDSELGVGRLDQPVRQVVEESLEDAGQVGLDSSGQSTFGGNDRVELGDGLNTWNGASGVKHVNGGEDRDILTHAGVVAGPTFAQLREGDDQFSGNLGVDTVDGGPGDDTINGGDGDDALTALDGPNSVSGGPGHDVIRTGRGVDRVRGEGGNDDIVDLGLPLSGPLSLSRTADC